MFFSFIPLERRTVQEILVKSPHHPRWVDAHDWTNLCCDGWRKKIQCQWISLLRSCVFQFLWIFTGSLFLELFFSGTTWEDNQYDSGAAGCSRNLRENKVFKTSMHFTPPAASISVGIQRRPGNRESLDVPTDIAVRCNRRADFQTAKKGAKKPPFNISERFGDDSWQCNACCFLFRIWMLLNDVKCNSLSKKPAWILRAEFMYRCKGTQYWLNGMWGREVAVRLRRWLLMNSLLQTYSSLSMLIRQEYATCPSDEKACNSFWFNMK